MCAPAHIYRNYLCIIMCPRTRYRMVFEYNSTTAAYARESFAPGRPRFRRRRGSDPCGELLLLLPGLLAVLSIGTNSVILSPYSGGLRPVLCCAVLCCAVLCSTPQRARVVYSIRRERQRARAV
jgi:hypothetical protein